MQANQPIESQQAKLRIARMFDIPDGVSGLCPYGSGHINDTYLVTTPFRRYIMQRVNARVFAKPLQVIENIERVTAYLRDVIRREGGDPLRETLTLIPTRAGGYAARDEEGGYWRMYRFIEETVSCDLPETTALFELSGSWVDLTPACCMKPSGIFTTPPCAMPN